MKKKFITLLMAIVFIFALAGCSSGNEDKINDLYNKLSEMQQEIDSLKNDREISEQIKEITKSLSDLNDEIAAMKTQSAEWEKLQTRLESLETTVEKLVTGSEKLNSEITDLKSELDTAKARITVLEAAVNTEPVICDFGDTYTLKNNGIELFSIKFLYYDRTIIDNNPTMPHLHIEITNISMPDCKLDNYLMAYAINEKTSETYYVDSQLISYSILERNVPKEVDFVFKTEPSKELITKIYLGVPNRPVQDQSLIPYVILQVGN